MPMRLLRGFMWYQSWTKNSLCSYKLWNYIIRFKLIELILFTLKIITINLKILQKIKYKKRWRKKRHDYINIDESFKFENSDDKFILLNHFKFICL